MNRGVITSSGGPQSQDPTPSPPQFQHPIPPPPPAAPIALLPASHSPATAHTLSSSSLRHETAFQNSHIDAFVALQVDQCGEFLGLGGENLCVRGVCGKSERERGGGAAEGQIGGKRQQGAARKGGGDSRSDE